MTATYMGAGFIVNGNRVCIEEPMGERPARVGDDLQIGDLNWTSKLSMWCERVFIDPTASPPLRVMVPHGAVLELPKAITIVVREPGVFSRGYTTVPVGRYAFQIGDELLIGERHLTERSLIPLHGEANSLFQLGGMQIYSWPIKIISLPEGAASRTA